MFRHSAASISSRSRCIRRRPVFIPDIFNVISTRFLGAFGFTLQGRTSDPAVLYPNSTSAANSPGDIAITDNIPPEIFPYRLAQVLNIHYMLAETDKVITAGVPSSFGDLMNTSTTGVMTVAREVYAIS
jgi:hypothetical protein